MYQSTHTGAQVDEAVDKALSADAVPTPGSTNLVTSGGVYGLVSNRNLLDNPWFRVNQRGATSGTQSQPYIADRWKVSYGSGGVTYSRTDDTVTIQSTSGSSHADLVQTFETSLSSALDGKTVTFSVMLNDYSIRSTSFVFTKSTNVWKTLGVGLDGGIIGVTWVANNNWIYVQKNNTPETFRAFKLELGSVSTLANDTPPCFAEELAKCQRYFVRVPIVINRPYAFGVATSAQGTQIRAVLPLPATMRTTPTATLTGTSIKAVGNAQSLSVSAVATDSIIPGGVISLLTVSGATQNQCYTIVGGGDATLDFSADL